MCSCRPSPAGVVGRAPRDVAAVCEVFGILRPLSMPISSERQQPDADAVSVSVRSITFLRGGGVIECGGGVRGVCHKRVAFDVLVAFVDLLSDCGAVGVPRGVNAVLVRAPCFCRRSVFLAYRVPCF